MAKIESLRRAPEPSGNGRDPDGDGWAALSPEVLDLLSAGDPPAFATDSRERIVFWNSGASAVLGRRSEEALGRRCSEVVCGRDVFGNRFCYQNCAVSAMARAGEPISGFELRLPPAKGGGGRALLHVTILRIPGPRPDLFTLVHVLQPIDEGARAARALAPIPSATLATPPLRTDADAPPLTAREVEVMQLVAAGLQNKEIAEKLGLSLATVRNHVHNSLEKLDVHSKLEMVSLAFRKGWVRRPGTAPPA
jgi:DNA-binding CsgD family transcriptional regulator